MSEPTPPGPSYPEGQPYPQQPYPQATGPGYGGYPPPPFPGGPVAPREPSKTMAIIALVLAILPCGVTWLVAMVLAVIVLVQSRKGTARGAGMAVAALVISVIWLVASVIGIALIVNEVSKYAEARDAGVGVISANDIRVGDCLVKGVSDTVISTIEITRCTEPHRGEVFAVFSVNEGEDPTQDSIDTLAADGCEARFADYVGVPFDKSALVGTYISPDKDAVALNDEVACVVSVAGDAPSTGSVKGSGR
ncbi:MAG: septum formation family protein [Propionibacteriales bacterium]|nr:septum formation family protein [Propionibacteriales bacterium]